MRLTFLDRKLTRFVSVITATVIATVTLSPLSLASVSNGEPQGKVSFTFDDGYESFITEAAPTLAQYNMSGTAYMTTDSVGRSGYLNWEQTTELQNNYGWEIGSHSASHPLMTEISDEQLEYEVSQSKLALQQHGFNPTSFATPYGDYNDKVVAAIAKYYTNHRPFHDIELPNTWPYNDYLLQVKQVQAGVSVSQVQQYINEAKANNTWLILVFHDIKDSPSSNPEDYEYSTSDLDKIASYVKSQNVSTANISESLVTVDEDKLPNNSFENGLSEGWTTNAPNNVVPDNQNHGSYPEPQNSIKMTAANDKNVHLFSPKSRVSKDNTYVVKSYVNIISLSSGEVALYIDEYDGNGNWISGQYKGHLTSLEAKNINISYNPTSYNVAEAGLQFIVTAGSGITAYVDNVEWFSTTPESAPENPNPEQPQNNMLANSSFEAGLADGWTTDSPANITADNQNHGSPVSPEYSIKFSATSKNIHLFSPLVSVDAIQTYRIKHFLNVSTIQSGEVAFYIDEYDANGNWVSGQYLSNARIAGAKNGNITYAPTTTSVHSARLQVIVTANSGITAYIDDVEWYANDTSSTPTSPEEEPASPSDPDPNNPDNLLVNAAFDNGISDGWTTDNSVNIFADSNNNGGPNNPQNAIKLTSGVNDTRNSHLFSPLVQVNTGQQYSLGGYLHIVAIDSGEVAFYIDEYDANGNWVSGQYLSNLNALGAHTLQLAYTPSGGVAKAKLQVIITSAPGTVAYLDDLSWMSAN